MSKQRWAPTNRITEAHLSFVLPNPRLPLMLPVRAWLMANWPSDHCWLRAVPTGQHWESRPIWEIRVYEGKSAIKRREIAHLSDVAALDLLEDLVFKVRDRYGLAPPKKRLGDFRD